jgi:hypothetical protein
MTIDERPTPNIKRDNYNNLIIDTCPAKMQLGCKYELVEDLMTKGYYVNLVDGSTGKRDIIAKFYTSTVRPGLYDGADWYSSIFWDELKKSG